MKLINNMVCGVHIASIAEAVALIAKAGSIRTSFARVDGWCAGKSHCKSCCRTNGECRDRRTLHRSPDGKGLLYAVAEGSRLSADLPTVEWLSVLFGAREKAVG